MKLPSCDRAEIPNPKLVSYLLDHDHPQNKGKAAFYEIVGFTKANAIDLKVALLKFVLEYEVVKSELVEFGMRYVVEGWLPCPNGKSYPL